MKDKRVGYVDVLKAVGILFMILDHHGFGHVFDVCTHAFHMPLFFFVSGYLYHSGKKLKEILQRKLLSLMIPYICAGIINYIVWLLLTPGSSRWKPIIHLMTDNTEGLPIAGALWFLTALMGTCILFDILTRLIRNKWLFMAGVLLLSGIGMGWDMIAPFRLWWSMDISFAGLLFYYLGSLFGNGDYPAKPGNPMIKKYLVKCLEIRERVIILLVGMAGYALCLKNGYVNMRMGRYAVWPMTVLNALLLICFWWNVSRKLWNHEFAIFRCVGGILEWIGKNSIIFVCFNQVMLLFSYMFCGKLFEASSVCVRNI